MGEGAPTDTADTAGKAIKATDIFSANEIRRLSARSDAMGAWLVLSAWGLIGLAMAMVALWPNPATFIIAVMVIGGRLLSQ